MWPKIACNFICIQFCQYGCLSTSLDIRNAVLGDEDPPKYYQLYIVRQSSDCIFLCIFSNFLCIYKNGWPQFLTAPIALKLLLVLNYVLKQLWTNYEIPNQHFGFSGHLNIPLMWYHLISAAFPLPFITKGLYRMSISFRLFNHLPVLKDRAAFLRSSADMR